eukprot:m.32452 g.32452  ORF g.32452 m.32452 type:complete len:217 (-) comp14971_c0_seq2:46-696(-)
MPQRYYTPSEVAQHSTQNDLWLSFLGKVVDLSSLAEAHAGDLLMKPIVAVAGTDISHWFDQETKDIRKHVDPTTGCLLYFTPKGRFLHIPPACPRTDWSTDIPIPWWKDEKYVVGTLTKKVRKLRIVNVLASQSNILEVCSEETITEIQNRYSTYNTHTSSYTWKHLGKNLEMDKTLEENSIPDESDLLSSLDINELDDECVAEVQVYYNDDLTEG